MNQIRVHVGPMPEMLRTIIGDLLDEAPDIVIAGNSSRPEESLSNARRNHADILITEGRDQAGDTCLDLMLAESPLGVFALSADGRCASSVALVRREFSVESEGRSTFVEAIRRMAEELSFATAETSSSVG